MALTWIRTHDWDINAWRNRSACRDSDPDVFFPIGTTGPALEQIETAQRICTACTVRDECLEFALATNQEAGHLGRHHRGGTAQAAQGLVRQAAPLRQLIPPRSRPARRSVRQLARNRWPQRDLEVHAGPVPPVDLDRPAELAGHERLHDRQARDPTSPRARIRAAGRRRRRPRRPPPCPRRATTAPTRFRSAGRALRRPAPRPPTRRRDRPHSA